MAQVLMSTFDDPFVNLALEACLLKLWRPGKRWLFLWQNRPCVVIGRFQNPWLECRMDILARRRIPLVRRTSGGGCVYHDEGNLCFSFFGPCWNKGGGENLDFLISSLNKWGLSPRRNRRHDLLQDFPDGTWRKISGSAFKQKKDRAIHHGTLLVTSNLDALNTLLAPLPSTITTRALPSTPARVANISEINPGLTVSKVWEGVARDYSSHIRHLADDFIRQNSDIYQKEYSAISHWQWRYGETPRFTQTLDLPPPSPHGEPLKFQLEVGNGVIRKIIPLGHPPPLPHTRQIQNALIGKKYSSSVSA